MQAFHLPMTCEHRLAPELRRRRFPITAAAAILCVWNSLLLQPSFAQSSRLEVADVEEDAVDKIDDEQAKIVKAVRAGWSESMSRLRSGVFRVVGDEIPKPDAIPADEKLRIFSAFDFDGDRLRFDRERPTLLVSDDPEAPYTLSKRGGKLILLTDKTIMWQLFNEGIQATVDKPRSRNVAGAGSLDPIIEPFDVRCAGSFTIADLERGWTWEQTLNRLSAPVTEAEIQEGRFYRLLWRRKILISKTNPGSDDYVILKELLFDAQQGFCPIKWTMRTGKAAINANLPPTYFTETKWKQINDVWVPVAIHDERRPGNADDLTRRDMTFDWESVNEGVDDRLFTIEGMDLPPQTSIYDKRFGVPVELKRTGEPVRSSK